MNRFTVAWLPCLLVTFFIGTVRAAEEARPPEITDKTLVAWIQVTDFAQRGGSGVLTIIDTDERFDAIVFGELHAGRWMAGSDFYRRTWSDQTGWPVETAQPDTLVQIAVVYRGRQVTIYRDAQEYASYEIKEPQVFGADASVLIGLRFFTGGSEVGFFKGVVDDARIYDRALSAAQIAALKPNRASDPRPLAWWHFEDGKAEDKMGRFSMCRLMRGATIADGKLLLGGNRYLWAWDEKDEKPEEEDTFDRTVQTMFYKARSPRTGKLWDTWIFRDEVLDKGTWYMFALANVGKIWDNISLATSPDGVHWTEHGRILEKRKCVTWMGTGSTWRSPTFAKDGKFYLNFSECHGPRQTIFFAESKDLLNWKRLDEHEFVQDQRWYDRLGRWDCIWTVPKPDGGGLYGYWTATPSSHWKKEGGGFGFGQTTDGVHWEALPPPKAEGHGEVGAVAKIGNRYYMMIGRHPKMWTLVADRPEGPFRAPAKNTVLLDKHTYFSRFLPSPDGLLINHHCMSRNRGSVFFSPLKTADIDEEGTLRLGWWKGNEKMKHRAVEVQVPATSSAIAMLGNTFNVADGLILEGTVSLADRSEDRRGLYVECAGGAGAAVLLDSAGKAEIGPIQPDGKGFKAEEKVDRETTFGRPAKFRLLVKYSLIELYLDDVLIECYSLPQDAGGRIGVIGGREAFGELRAWLATPKAGR